MDQTNLGYLLSATELGDLELIQEAIQLGGDLDEECQMVGYTPVGICMRPVRPLVASKISFRGKAEQARLGYRLRLHGLRLHTAR